MAQPAKTQAYEGGGKVYENESYPVTEYLRPADAISLKSAAVVASWMVPYDCTVAEFRSRLAVVSGTFNSDVVLGVQFREGTAAEGSGTSLGTITIANSGAAVGDRDESANLSDRIIPAGSVIEVEVTTAEGDATTLDAHVLVGICRVGDHL